MLAIVCERGEPKVPRPGARDEHRYGNLGNRIDDIAMYAAGRETGRLAAVSTRTIGYPRDDHVRAVFCCHSIVTACRHWAERRCTG